MSTMPPFWIGAICSLWVLAAALTVRTLLTTRTLGSDSIKLGDYRPSGLPLGSLLPDFSFPTTAAKVLNGDELKGKLASFLFLSSNCQRCQSLIDEFASVARPQQEGALVVVADRALLAGDEIVAGHDESETYVIADASRRLAKLFAVSATPYAFVTGRQGQVLASGSPPSWRALLEMIDRAKESETLLNGLEAANSS